MNKLFLLTCEGVKMVSACVSCDMKTIETKTRHVCLVIRHVTSIIFEARVLFFPSFVGLFRYAKVKMPSLKGECLSNLTDSHFQP